MPSPALLRPSVPAVADAPVATARRSTITRLLATLTVLIAVTALSACTAPTSNSSSKGQQIVNLARTHIGKPYVYGASGPNSFDCSGLSQYVYRQAGINIPRTTGAQQAAARPIAKSAAQPGDIIFIGGYHLGIYVGGGQMIDAPKTGARVNQRAIWTSAYSVGRFY